MNSNSIRSRAAKPSEVAMKAHELLYDDNPKIIDVVDESKDKELELVEDKNEL